ncbi:SH3 domain-containing protein [Metabacillus herbersteinensis]|uniref:SH3 domain-containing protein n=1 Tax=Metabacillus herbersteinensis TaxID=283816 RepID=A0ABV6G8W3_9BACI
MFRKVLTVFTCFTLLIASFFLIPQKTLASDQAVINVDLLNVRSGPGLSYSVVAKVKKGQNYDIVDKKNDWVQLKLSSNQKGWVAAWLVNQKKAKVSVSQGSSSSNTVESSATGLRIRSGPGTTFPVIGVFEKGKKASFVEKSGSWIKVSLAGKQGWVSSSYVKYTEVKAPPASSQSSTGKTGKVNATSLNVRKTPSTQGSVLGSLKNGASVSIVTQQGKWIEIHFKNLKGWVHSDYLKIEVANTTTPAAPPTTTTSKLGNGTVSATSINVRSSGAMNGKVVGAITKGTKVTLLEEANKWYKISYGTNKTGWVASWYITKIAETSQPTSTSGNKSVKIIYNGTNIRSGPSTGHSIVSRGNSGQQFAIQETKGDWYKISLPNNRAGYVAGWVVETAGVSDTVSRPGVQQYLKNKTIVIDPGHGGRDSGAVGARGSLEKNLTLRTSKLIFDKLKASGANVFLTRSNDSYISLNSRISTSHYRDADAFVSVHYDSFANRSVTGVTSYYYNSLKDKPLATSLHNELAKQSNIKNRGVRYGNFHVVRENKKPSVLLELGFISNSTEELTVGTNSYQERVSQAIYTGLAKHFK